MYGKIAPRMIGRRSLFFPFWLPGLQTSASQVVGRWNVPEDCVMPAGLPNFVSSGTANATGSTAFNIQQNGTTIGTLTVASGVGNGTQIATVSFTQNVHLKKNDVVTIVGPATADATLADFSGTITLIAKINPGV